jgi:hypothetical protein
MGQATIAQGGEAVAAATHEAIMTARLISEKERQRQILIEKRARALALMLLTRRADLLIEEVKDDIGLDYIVRFHTAGKEGLREFGVRLCGAWAAATKNQADEALDAPLQQLKRAGPFLRPVCLFLFTMEDDGAWYTWVAEPRESKAGEPLLRVCDEADCRPLDQRALKGILDRVDGWHEAAFHSLIRNGPGESRGDPRRAKQ